MRLGTAVGILILAGVFFISPFQVFAEDPILGGSLVPNCDAANQSDAGFGSGFAGACQLCDFVTLANNIIRFAVAFSVIAATLMFAYAGALYFTAAASEANIKKAHGIFSKVFAGLVIVLIAWLLVHLFMQTLTNQDEFGPWHEIRCVPYPVGQSLADRDDTRVSARAPTPRTTGGGGQCVGGGTAQRSDNSIANPCPDCIALQLTTQSSSCYKGNPSGQYCVVKPALSTALLRLNTTQAITITGAVGGTHCASCQIAGSPDVGTCVDAVTTARSQMQDPALVRQFINAASNAGLRAVLEFPTSDARFAFLQAGQAAGITFQLSEVIVVGHASGIHYSIYKD